MRAAIRTRRGPMLAAAVLAVTTLGATVPASEATSDHSRGCHPAHDAATDGGHAAARTTRPADGPTYTREQVRRIDRRLQRRLDASRATQSAVARVGAVLRIGVHFHVVANDGSRGVSKKRVLRQLDVLDKAYAGGQAADSSVTRFDFHLASFDRTRRTSWHRARVGGRADMAMRRTLRRGGPDALNIYVLEPRDPFGQAVVLGWATPPSDARRHTSLDGVVVNQESMPGGSLNGYNRGDTAVHEVGHWLGLFHTFEGGCEGQGDMVADTPAQSVASTACDPTKDSCTANPGLDPVRNFMDYAVDDCMDMFTAGQVSRMHDNWLAYRTP